MEWIKLHIIFDNHMITGIQVTSEHYERVQRPVHKDTEL